MAKQFLLIIFFNMIALQCFGLECGTYNAKGIIKEINHSLYFTANEKSKSEINLEAENTLETKLAPFLNRPVVIEFKLKRAFEGSNGTLGEITKIELRVPNPAMGSLDTFIKLNKKEECKK